ncbi:four-carbon acid sugar kinase family protein [Kineococcus sp. TBRC 1896]|uniref:Four-carbon acid sugar kinase family protein n=1 Tax=Kineococcus mangrovi TaxID=1660183 RepID=A0ABV4I1L9_9ACTN
MNHKTVVLDDDPTGTQSATGVRVLLRWGAPHPPLAELLHEALREADGVYVQTNSRALDEAAALALVTEVRDAAREAGRLLGARVRCVLRGDSTLRGHVFAETGAFTGPDDVVLFVPAFPAGGRTTVDGVHLVRTADGDVPAGETEYAADPVFGFTSSRLSEYVREKSGRTPVPVARPDALARALEEAPAGAVLLPDVRDDADVQALADAVRAWTPPPGRDVVVRCAAPLAAALAGVTSTGFLDRPLRPGSPHVLVVCGSHTDGARAQLEALARRHGPAHVLPTADALADPVAAGEDLAERARADLAAGVAVVATERVRSGEHGTLAHGEAVMTALVAAVQRLVPDADAVVSKGGITAAEVARTGIGADTALVEGQVAAGISVWRMAVQGGDGDRDVLQVVVPGNVGGPDAVVDAVAALGR